MKNKFWFICLLLISISCNDEKDLKPSLTDGYIKMFTGSGNDEGEVIKTLEDGFIILGNTIYNDGSIQTKLIRLDINGNTLWTKHYGGGVDIDNNNLLGKSIAVLDNNTGYIIIGDRINNTDNPDSTSMYLFKVDGNGDNFSGIDITSIELSDGVNDYSGDTHGVDVFITADNTILTLTQMDAGTNNDASILVSERNISDFSLTCTPKFVQKSGIRLLKSLYKNSSTNYSTAGGSLNGISNIIDIPDNCNSTTSATIINIGSGFEGNQIIPSGNNFAIVGTTNDDIYITIVTNKGVLPQTKIYSNIYSEVINSIEEGFSVCTTTDGGYMIVGSTRITSGSENEIANEVDIIAIKTDSFGSMQWFRKFGNTNEETAVYVQQTSDGGYAILANIEYGGIDMMALIKTDKNGDLD